MCGMRRSSLDVTVNILEAAQGGANKTRIVYGSNLNFEIVKGYINTLVNNGFLEVDGKRYLTTERGVKFVEEYRELMKPLQLA
ncbi:MAG: transcriptional regulator [Candidatus Bathyarchaeota archaeon]|nr:transcriptional regulator [Candidatus Bathyarchaeota archaeon]